MTVGVVGLIWLSAAGILILHLDAEGHLDQFTRGAETEQSQTRSVVLPEPPDANADQSGELEVLEASDVTASEYALEENSQGAVSDASDDADAPVAEAPPPIPPTEVPEVQTPARQDARSFIERYPSLKSAYDEPVKQELNALMDALLDRFEAPLSNVEPELADFLEMLVGRINSQGQPYVVRLRGRDIDDMRVRAVRAHAMMVATGVHPWLLDVFGERGERGVSVDYAF